MLAIRQKFPTIHYPVYSIRSNIMPEVINSIIQCHLIEGRISAALTMTADSKSVTSAIATPSRQRRVSRRGRRLKLFRKTTFLVNDQETAVTSDQEQEVNKQQTETDSKLRIVQFSQETALSKSIRRKAKSEGKPTFLDFWNSKAFSSL